MRTTLPIGITVILLTSCSRYQYTTISSSDTKKNDKQEFVIENDSIRVQYNFNGEDAPINLTIQNKLNQPVYVDWRQSALIVNDKAICYSPNTVPIEGVFQGTTLSWNSRSPYNSYSAVSDKYSSTSGTISAKATLPDKLDFIPPLSYIIKNPMGVTNQFLGNMTDSVFHLMKITAFDGTSTRVKHAVFTETSSPMRFKSYLTLFIGEPMAKPVAYQNSFYISEIYITDLDPETFWYGNQYKGNQYYVQETTGFGKGFGVVTGAVLLTSAAALQQNSIDKQKE